MRRESSLALIRASAIAQLSGKFFDDRFVELWVGW